MNQYKHIFFDLDRTLWDFEKNSKEALLEIFQQFKISKQGHKAIDFISQYHYFNDLLWEDYRKGRLTKEILRKRRFEQTLAYFGINNTDLALSMNEVYLDICPKKCFLLPHTMEILEYLRKKYKLYILSNGFKETQFKKLKNTGLLPVFSKVYTSEEIGINKPKPGIFAFAVNSVNAKKKECLMIGDDYNVDILGAMNYGIDQGWLNIANEMRTPAPTFSILSLNQLKNIL